MDPSTQLDLSKLSDADKKELNQFLNNEAQKSNIQQSKWNALLVLYDQVPNVPPPSVAGAGPCRFSQFAMPFTAQHANLWWTTN